jgi:hypothetical protein
VATPSEVQAGKRNEDSFELAREKYYEVAGPRSPLRQAEHGHLTADGANMPDTTAFTTIAPRWAARVSCACDRPNQSWSSVNTSSSTLLSTSVPGAGFTYASAPGFGQWSARCRGTAHALHLLGSSVSVDEHASALLVDLEVDIAARVDTERAAHF